MTTTYNYIKHENRTKFINFCHRKLGRHAMNELKNCILNKYESELDFFDICNVEDYVSNVTFESGNGYKFWYRFNDIWRAHLYFL